MISIKNAYCEANKYASYNGAGDCRWSLALTPELRRQADEALAPWSESEDEIQAEREDYVETTEESERSSYERSRSRSIAVCLDEIQTAHAECEAAIQAEKGTK